MFGDASADNPAGASERSAEAVVKLALIGLGLVIDGEYLDFMEEVIGVQAHNWQASLNDLEDAISRRCGR